MSNSREVKRARSTQRRKNRLGVVARQRTGVSPRSGRLRAVRPQPDDYPDDYDARAVRLDVPAIPETAAREIHVLCVSLHGATPPPWRLLEMPSAMTLDRLHELLQRMFGWYGICPHSFVTIYGEFFGLMGPTSRTAAQTGEPRDESGVALAQAAGEEGLGIAYLYGYRDEWQVQIRVEKILSAAVGVAYPRCTRGRGEDIPGEGCWGVPQFNAERLPTALDNYFDPEELTDDLADLATVIVSES
jgi:Plasmid pRiA4b ORF-3-like protein